MRPALTLFATQLVAKSQELGRVIKTELKFLFKENLPVDFLPFNSLKILTGFGGRLIRKEKNTSIACGSMQVMFSFHFGPGISVWACS